MKSLVEKWLKSGVTLQSQWTPTEEGTPQGGVISPLLCNICLHGLETELGQKYTSQGFVDSKSILIIRFADDIVILGHTLEEVRELKVGLDNSLATRGLEISEKKTRIVHTRALRPQRGCRKERLTIKDS